MKHPLKLLGRDLLYSQLVRRKKIVKDTLNPEKDMWHFFWFLRFSTVFWSTVFSRSNLKGKAADGHRQVGSVGYVFDENKN